MFIVDWILNKDYIVLRIIEFYENIDNIWDGKGVLVMKFNYYINEYSNIKYRFIE